MSKTEILLQNGSLIVEHREKINLKFQINFQNWHNTGCYFHFSYQIQRESDGRPL